MTEDKIKKYFLGELSETENDSFEEEVARNRELFEQAQIIENELIDDYLHNRLSSSERILFEKKFLTTPARRQKVKFSLLFLSDLQKKLPITSQTSEIIEPKSFRQSLTGLFEFYRIFAVAAMAIIIFSGFYLFWFSRQSESDVANLQIPNQSPTPENSIKNNLSDANSNNLKPQIRSESNSEDPALPQISNTKKTTLTPEPKISTTPGRKSSESSNPIFAVFTLAPGMLRDNGEQSLKIPAATDKIRLRLQIPEDSIKYQNYRATIKTAEGETVFSAPNLSTLNLILPASKLPGNTYVVFLEGKLPSRPAESVAEYTFRVER